MANGMPARRQAFPTTCSPRWETAASPSAADAASAAADATADTDAAADASAAYAAEFTAAARRLSAVLYDAADLPALREAVAWQNRHALTTGIDVLRRRGREL